MHPFIRLTIASALAILTLSIATGSAVEAAAPKPSGHRVFTAAGAPTNDAFFPIAVWLQDPRNAARYQAAGINLYIGLWNGPTDAQLDALAKVGMPVICEQNKVGLARKDDPIIAGWMHGDEPDNAQELPSHQGYGPPIPPATIVKEYDTMRAADPTRPVMLNLGQSVAWDNYIGRGVRRNHPEDYPEYVRGGDIVSFDIYPVVHDSKEIVGHLEYVPRGVERLRSWAGPQRQVWNCLECTHIGAPDRKATPAQVRAEAWMALIRGSQGLVYFVHQFKPNFREAALLDDAEMVKAVTALNRQIQSLAPVLHSPTVADGVALQAEPKDTVSAVLKQHAGGTWVFAANFRNEPAHATFTLRAPAGASAEVLEESRSLPLTGQKFSDDFAPYAVHLYHLASETK